MLHQVISHALRRFRPYTGQAAQRFRKHAWNTTAQTLLFDLEDGCRQKEMSRELLLRELPRMPRRKEVQVAVRINPFRTEEQTKHLLDLCAELGLVPTGSSDYHGPTHKTFARFGAYDTYGLGEPQVPSRP